jgi:hypothetical protein
MLRRVLDGRYPTFSPRVTSEQEEEEGGYADKGVEIPPVDDTDDVGRIRRTQPSAASYWTW